MAKPSPFEEAQELQSMLVTYAKQETVDPLKALGSYLMWGIAGALSIFLGAFFIGLATLRLLQSEVSQFDGGGIGSVAPYAGALGAFIVLIGLIVFGFLRAKKAIS